MVWAKPSSGAPQSVGSRREPSAFPKNAVGEEPGLRSVKGNMREQTTWLEISLRNLESNFRLLQNVIGPDVGIMPVVKANAYGHGLVPCALRLWAAGAEQFAVATIEEALELREAGLKAPILVLYYVPAGRLVEAVQLGISVTLSDLGTARALGQIAEHWQIVSSVHLMIDTGMHSLGFDPEDVPEAAREISQQKGLRLDGIFSHFADVSDDPEFTQDQLGCFQSVLFDLQRLGFELPLVHLANSAAALTLLDARFDAVRTGRVLYGFGDDLADDIQPVMRLKTRVAGLRRIEAGETVGYGRTYKAEKPRQIATLPIGYSDGYARHLSNKGVVLIGGRRCEIVGRICMNLAMADVTSLAILPQIGEEVVVLGEQGTEKITAAQVAAKIETIGYEVVARMSPSLPRVYEE